MIEWDDSYNNCDMCFVGDIYVEQPLNEQLVNKGLVKWMK